MAYKYQRGLQVSSGSLHVEHDLTGSGNNILGQANTAVHRAFGTLNLSDADGASYGLKLGGTLVTATAAELNLLDAASAGVKGASTAAIYSSSGSLNTWGLAVVDGAYDLKVASHDGTSNGLVLGTTLVTADASELNKLDGVTATTAELNYVDVTAGTAAASKALVLDSNKDITGILNITASYFTGDGSAITNISMESLDLTRGYLWIGDSDGEASMVNAKADGKILVGDGTDLLSVTVGGDVTLASDGDIEIGNAKLIQRMYATGSANANVFQTGSIRTAHIRQGQVTMASLGTGSVETAALASGSVTRPKIGADAVGPEQMLLFDDALAAGSTKILIGDGTDYSEFALSGDVTMTNAGVVTIGAGAVENSMLANSAVTLTQGAGMAAMGSVSLGSSVTVAVDGNLEDLDTLGVVSSNGEMIVGTGAGAYAYESGATLRTSIGVGTGDTLTLAGLSVTGNATLGNGGEDTVSIDAGQLNIANGIAYEGIKYKNEDYTVSAGDYLINCGAGNTLTLPAVGTLEDGTTFVIKNGDGDASASSAVTIDGNGAETLDGATTILLESPYAAVTVMVSGSGWLVL
jgi:hypothetical protein